MKKLAITVVLSGMLFGTSFGQEKFDKDHPRRAEVNHRLRNQDHRINKEEKHGEISHAKAEKLHQKDHEIRHEERAMAKENHGHITKQEKKTLNHQENHNSRKIGK